MEIPVRHLFNRKKFPGRMFLDMLLIPSALWLAFALRYDSFWPTAIEENGWLFAAATVLVIPLFIHLGVYRAMPAYVGIKAFYCLVKALSLHAVLLLAFSTIVNTNGVPITVFAIYWFVSLAIVGGNRVLLRSLLKWFEKNKYSPKSVVVYGAGSAGVELADALQAGQEFSPIAFIDDKKELQGKEIRGIKVYPTNHLEALIHKYHVSQVLLAIPSSSPARRQTVVNYLAKFPVHVRSVPALADIVSGRSKIQDLREIDIEDILGRDPVSPDQSLLSACITGKSVMVTGAGGSIGSELCRQIIELQPSRVVLFEICEFALYSIDKELRDFCNVRKKNISTSSIEIVPILGSVTDEGILQRVLDTFNIQTVYHAAAYKHVPLVEHNTIEGIKNNIFGTWCTAKAVLNAGVETFILISTDKAVRPTSVMGASKRMAELVVQALARQSFSTRFSIVRFGNVLGSSGSVVPLFREQIKNGGPITITHPEVTRYFMTIPEAAQLVIQAGAMARGGEVFVLDMGKPVRILDLAHRMISLIGLSVRDRNNPNGDISIETTQLRPGEKLYEELLLGNNVTHTQHPRIMQANEEELPLEQITKILKQLEGSCASHNIGNVRKLLKDYVDYMPTSGIEDMLWIAESQKNKIPISLSPQAVHN